MRNDRFHKHTITQLQRKTYTRLPNTGTPFYAIQVH